jgi:hypothetical protein
MSRPMRNHPIEMRAELARRHGSSRGLLTWLRLTLWSAVARVWLGRLRFHLCLAHAALLNGSAHCGYVQSFAFQLAYFGRRRALFPVDESKLLLLARQGSDDLREGLDAALAQAQLPGEAALLRRLYALKIEGDAPRTFTDRCLARLVELMDVATCSCIAGAWPIEELVRGQASLKQAYTQARLAQTSPAPRAR